MLRRKAKKEDPSPDGTEPTHRNRYMPPTELEDNGAAYGSTEAKHSHPNKPKPLYELDSSRSTSLHELDSKHIAAELPAQ